MHEKQDAPIKVPNPSTLPMIDLYLEKPASFFGLYRNDIAFTNVTSKLCIFNVGPLHISFEIIGFKKQSGTPSGGFQHEVDDKPTSGDGDFHR
jgi:hypothetical protein